MRAARPHWTNFINERLGEKGRSYHPCGAASLGDNVVGLLPVRSVLTGTIGIEKELSSVRSVLTGYFSV